MRWFLLLAAGATATVAPASALAGYAPTAPAPQVATLVYSVQPDARKCASPMCGGYWLREVNHARTRCADGTSKPTCYVARLAFASAKEAAGMRAARAGTLLARGLVGHGSVSGFPSLGHLTVATAWAKRGSAESAAPVYEVRTTKIQCVADPCFTLLATRMNTGAKVTLSDVDLASLPAASRQLAEKAMRTTGLVARGRVQTLPDEGPAGDGRALVVEAFYQRI